jgi:ribosome-binding factor A
MADRRRLERVASVIRQEVGQELMRGLEDPRLDGTLPSVTRVRVAPDLAVADVYMSFMGTPGKQSAALHAIRGAASLFRGALGKALSTRIVPQLRFHIDEQLDKELAVLDLIRRSEQEREAKEEQPETPEPETPDDDQATAG